MAPPPITPSPHRFITSKPANATTKPSSSLRFQTGAPHAASSQQFTPAPRFNFGSTQKPAIDNVPAAPQHASPPSRRLRLPSTTSIKHREDIEETDSDNEETGRVVNDGSPFALPSQPTLKRRRPNPSETLIISSDSASPSPPPTTPPYPTVEEDDHDAVPYDDCIPQARPRFVLPAPKPTGTPSIPSRPPVILPPRSPSPTITTPTFFSPHRRGQKYVPGGLASTLREWIVDTSQQAHNRAHARRGEEESWDATVRVGEYRMGDTNEGMILVHTRREAKEWMLVGRGRGEANVEVGCIIGIREPTWEVQVGHDIYVVAIEWQVLNG